MNEIIRNDLNPVRLLIQTRDYDKVFRVAWFNRREKEIIVMFGKRKKKEAEGQEMLLRELRGGLEELGGKMDRMQSALDKISQDGEALDDCLTGISDDLDMLDNGLEEWERTLRSQTDSLEDLLDTMEAQSRGETELQQRLSEAEEREQALLDLVSLTRDQLDMVSRRLSGDAAWSDQFAMMSRESAKLLRNAGIRETGVVGEPVDYEIHQVLEAVETDKKEQDHTVASVFSVGRIYCGRILGKAKVAAYRLKGET